jgi:hypothetical protein
VVKNPEMSAPVLPTPEFADPSLSTPEFPPAPELRNPDDGAVLELK